MYCDTILFELAVKLKEKGYPQDHDVRYVWLNGRAVDVLWMDEFERCRYDDAERDGTLVAIPTYAQVFDWLAEKGLIVVVQPCWDFANERITDEWESDIVRVGAFSSQPNATPTYHNTMQEAADAAIERALKLI